MKIKGIYMAGLHTSILQRLMMLALRCGAVGIVLTVSGETSASPGTSLALPRKKAGTRDLSGIEHESGTSEGAGKNQRPLRVQVQVWEL